MSITEMKRVIINRYHQDIYSWWRILGEMFEGTEGFTKSYTIRCRLEDVMYCIGWEDYSWKINRI